MNILVLSQVFFPDNVATSQALSDLVFRLAEKNHRVKVITSRHNYENPSIIYPSHEVIKEVDIHRLNNTGFGKRSPGLRILDFLTFNLLIFFRLIIISRKKTDVILTMTSPPLLPFLGVLIAQMKKIRFIFWAMDLQPELSIASGVLKKGSLISRFLQKIIDYSYRKSDSIITLDDFMANHIYDRVDRKKNIVSIPVWPMMNEVYEGIKENNPFVREYGLTDRIVIMYSGNHSLVHPLKTLLDTAAALKDDNRFLFIHIGSGVRLQEIIDRKNTDHLENIRILPFQPREKIHYSLSAADIQVVVLGDQMVGLTHPNKIYGAMFIGKPILYIGPEHSHITEILSNCPGNILIRHGEHEQLRRKLTEFAEMDKASQLRVGRINREYASKNFVAKHLIDRMVEVIEQGTKIENTIS